jgi:hypothetical protein
MAVYRNNPDGFKEIQRRSLRFTIPILVVVVVYIIVLSNKNSGIDMQADLLAFSLLLPAWWVGHYVGLKKQREIFLSYELTITNEYIERTQKKTPAIRINRAHVRNIVVRPNGNGMIIQSGETSDEIWVGKHIENPEEVIRELSSIMTPNPSLPESEQKHRLVSPIVSIFGFIAVGVAFLASDKWVVIISASMAVIIFSYNLLAISRNRNLDSRTKLLSFASLIIIIVLIVMIYGRLKA